METSLRYNISLIETDSSSFPDTSSRVRGNVSGKQETMPRIRGNVSGNRKVCHASVATFRECRTTPHASVATFPATGQCPTHLWQGFLQQDSLPRIRGKVSYICFLLLFAMTAITATAQRRIVVLDDTNGIPVPFANVYSTSASKDVKATATDSAGVAVVKFGFDRLNISHVNYGKREIAVGELNDTVWLTPKNVAICEVVVTGQREWIERLLQRFVSLKESIYKPQAKQFAYTYNSRTLSDSTGYAFSSNGQITLPQYQSKDAATIAPQNNTVYYKDKTAGADFTNLQRMVYGNLVDDIDEKFIRQHSFSQNVSYKNADSNVIQIMFSSRKFPDDKGYMVIDTATCRILETERTTGTEYNVKNNTSAAMRTIAKAAAGFGYEAWNVTSHTKYATINTAFYPVECSYKFFMRSNATKTGESYFSSIESDLQMQESSAVADFMELPRPYYMLLIKTKKMRLAEERLRDVEKTYMDFK